MLPSRAVRDRRIETLQQAVVQCRQSWRWWYGKFWQLRHENTLRRPSWRVEEETKAWRRMRAEVRNYAELRRQLREARLPAEAGNDAGVPARAAA